MPMKYIFRFLFEDYKQMSIDFFIIIASVLQSSCNLLFSYLRLTHMFCERLGMLIFRLKLVLN